MKRFASALVLCISLLGFGLWVMTEPVTAEGDVIMSLLEHPAPPPPNPLVAAYAGVRPPEFYDKSNPPPDNAPIEDLVEYWTRQSTNMNRLGHNIYPSEAVVRRLGAEVSRDPSSLPRLLNAFTNSPDGVRLVKDIYDRGGEDIERGTRGMIRSWLTHNSPYFSADLERGAERVADTEHYVSNQEPLLSLGRHNWQRAEPIANRLYNDRSQPVSRVLAMWVLYRRALDTDSLGDIDRYRSELMAVVEDRSLGAGIRDLALDALVKEKDWSGRDEWYYSLLADETLGNLEVNGATYTGLTTLIMYEPKEKYRAKMIELAASSNKAVRSAAVRNLIVIAAEKNGEDLVKAMLPWLTNPAWVDVPNDESGRNSLVRWLAEYKVPEAVPGLIAVLDEKEVPRSRPNSNSNVMSNANYAIDGAIGDYQGPISTTATLVNMTTNATTAANMAARTYSSNRVYGTEVSYPFRYSAISALAFQRDPRAIPPLRRLLGQMKEPYERGNIIGALVAVGGFTVEEQVNGLELLAKASASAEASMNAQLRQMANSNGSDWNDLSEEELGAMFKHRGANTSIATTASSMTDSLELQIGQAVIGLNEPGEPLIRGLIDRIVAREKSDPQTSSMLRLLLLRWKGPAIYAMLLRDLKNGKATSESIVRLLTLRKEIREKQSGDIYDARGGVPVAVAVTSCMLEDTAALGSMLTANAETAAAVLACARLIRAPLPVPEVIALLRSEDKRLSLAAEKYLESEDSPEARMAVLSMHPNEAMILGARHYFPGVKPNTGPMPLADELFRSVGSGSLYSSYWAGFENNVDAIKLRDEVINDQEMLGLYVYGENRIRIYRDRIIYQLTEDESRYRERPMTAEEFNYLKQYLIDTNADTLPPFLGQCSESCDVRELIMVGRNGGRRVFARIDKLPEFFTGLDRYFEDLKAEAPMQLRYAAGKELAGLEVIFASEDLWAQTVWKNGDDLRVLATDRKEQARKRKERIDAARREATSDEEMTVDIEIPDDEIYEDEFYGHEESDVGKFDGMQWYSVRGGELGPVAIAPPEIEYPPLKDGLDVAADEERWKATAGLLEIRAGEEGLYKLSQGKLTRLQAGDYSWPRISADGKWVTARKYDEEGYSTRTVRVNIATGREFPVDLSEQAADNVLVYMPLVSRFLLSSIGSTEYDYSEHARYQPDGHKPRSEMRNWQFAMLDPVTGAVQKVPGEVRPLAQQTFRRLQATGKPNEFWAALIDKKADETVVGIYDARFFNFKPVVRIPKIIFDSMDMWVDQAGGKVYFVYKGHLLAAPLYKPQG
jgi:HEAT repeat protein